LLGNVAGQIGEGRFLELSRCEQLGVAIGLLFFQILEALGDVHFQAVLESILGHPMEYWNIWIGILEWDGIIFTLASEGEKT